MAHRGHQACVLALLEPAAHCDEVQALPAHGVGVVEIRLPPRSYRAERRWLTSELARRPGAVAHSHGYHADLVGLCAARAAGTRIVSTAHGFTGGGWTNRLYEWCDTRALARFDGVVAVSRPLARLLVARGVPGPKVHVIPNAYGESHPLLDRVE